MLRFFKRFLGLWHWEPSICGRQRLRLLKEFCVKICCTAGGMEGFETGNGVTFQGESARESDYANYHQIRHCNHTTTLPKAQLSKLIPDGKSADFPKPFWVPFEILLLLSTIWTFNPLKPYSVVMDGKEIPAFSHPLSLSLSHSLSLCPEVTNNSISHKSKCQGAEAKSVPPMRIEVGW